VEGLQLGAGDLSKLIPDFRASEPATGCFASGISRRSTRRDAGRKRGREREREREREDFIDYPPANVVDGA